MGKIKPFGLLLGLLGNVMIAIALRKLIANGSCGDVGQPPCPSSLTPFVLMLPAGVVISVAAMFFGGGPVVFLGVFIGVGAGSIAAGLGSEDSSVRSFAIPFGALFIGIPFLLATLFAFLGRSGAQKAVAKQALVATGAKGIGMVVSLTDTGVTLNENPRVQISMRVEPDDGSAAFEATKTVVVSRVAIPRAGDRFPVWYDRADRTQWVYGTDLDATRATPEVQAQFARAAAAAHGPVDDLAKLAELKAAGVLTDGEFEAAKRRVLSS